MHIELELELMWAIQITYLDKRSVITTFQVAHDRKLFWDTLQNVSINCLFERTRYNLKKKLTGLENDPGKCT